MSYEDSFLRLNEEPKQASFFKGNKKMLMFGGGAVLATVAGAALYGIRDNTGVQKAKTSPVWGTQTQLQEGENYGQRLFGVGLKFEQNDYIQAGNANDWHIVRLTSEDGETYTWSNKAGVSWSLMVSETDWRGHPTQFYVGEDCPYYTDGYTTADVYYNDQGGLQSIQGPWNEWYSYVIDWTLPDMQIEMPSVWQVGLNFECSQYIDAGISNDWHFVTISNPSGDGEHFEWTNRAGVSWSLAPVYRFNDNGGTRLKRFNVGPNCPYYGDGHTAAVLRYKEMRGILKKVLGPWDEEYYHVIGFTPV